MREKPHPAAIMTSKGPLVFLFYDGYEWQLRRGFVGTNYAQARRLARFLYKTIRRMQVRTGFYTAFCALRTSLEKIGCDVRVNDYAMAARYPDYPIGVAGYPSVMDKIPPQNPIIFGPGDFGLPEQSAAVAKNDRFKILIQPSKWFCDVYRPYCGDKLMAWYAGIDTDAFPDLSKEEKTVDVLIYDKIRWHRDTLVPGFLEKIQDMLRRQNKSFVTLRYGHHAHFDFRREATRARSMIFVCEHETQGLAYQEAMSENLPIFAWDEGRNVDPYFEPYMNPDINVSSVPYFSDQCGMKFQKDNFEERFTEFWSKLETYRPRDYVLENLSMKKSAEAYLNAYLALRKTP